TPQEMKDLINQITENPLLDHVQDKKFLGYQPRPFEANDRAQAWFLIKQLPPHARGNLHEVAVDHIGSDAFLDTIRHAYKKHPSALPKHWLECIQLAHFDAPASDSSSSLVKKQRTSSKALLNNVYLRSNLYGNPTLIMKLLGPGAVVPQVVPTPFSVDQLLHSIQKAPSSQITGLLNLKHLHLDRVFDKIGAYTGFRTMEQNHCFNSFPDLTCPLATCLRDEQGHPMPVHANRISYPVGRGVVAAMQPVVNASNSKSLSMKDQRGLNEFFDMLRSFDQPLVIDLRNTADFSIHGAFCYYAPCSGEVLTFNRAPTVEPFGQMNTRMVCDLGTAGTRMHDLELVFPNQPVKRILLIAHTQWVDQRGVAPEQLRALSALFRQAIADGHDVIVHCKAGVGRTGTLITYSRLYEQLIVQGKGAELLDGRGQPDFNKLVTVVARAVIEGRVQRGGMWVQTREQFALIANTLKQDLLKWSQAGMVQQAPPVSLPTLRLAPTLLAKEDSPPDSPISAVADTMSAPHPDVPCFYANHWCPAHSALTVQNVVQPTAAVTLHANRVDLDGHAFVMAQEPKSREEKVQHWHALLSRGADVVEMVSDPKRFGLTCNVPWPEGLNPFTTEQLSQANAQAAVPVNFRVGQFEINSLHCAQTQSIEPEGRAAHITLLYTDLQTGEQKSVRVVQMLMPLKQKTLSAAQLSWACEQVEQAKLKVDGLWMTSAAGVGRPSALAMALMVRNMRATWREAGGVDTEKIQGWIAQGRRDRGPHFVGKPAQADELIKLAAL
ncbi:MAG TPA: protein-tyrosine phosphatase family protein, partial [Limnobacter sp.]|nr:protein-tyrosine phosphatase family protein [Limnobacter sp.]